MYHAKVMINKQRLVQTFLDLIKIDSPSGSESQIVAEVTSRLKDLGGKVELDKFGNVIAHFKGEGEPILLNAHLDTVEPGRNIQAQIAGDIIKSDGTTVLGGDPKAGVSAILEALTSVKEEKTKHLPIDVVFTLGEENGLVGAVNLDYHKIKAKRGVTFDGDDGVHNVFISAPGYNAVDVKIIGRGAHAGVEPEKGISAIKIASEIISQLKIGRVDHETTANIGMIEGGSARNAVPEMLHFKGEIRSRNLDKLEQHTTHFRQVFGQVLVKYPEATVEVSIERKFYPYLLDENHRVIQHLTQVMGKMRLQPNLIHTGGGTDVNIMHNHGIEAVVVGTGDYEAHTKREYVKISEMLQAAQFCEKLITS